MYWTCSLSCPDSSFIPHHSHTFVFLTSFVTCSPSSFIYHRPTSSFPQLSSHSLTLRYSLSYRTHSPVLIPICPSSFIRLGLTVCKSWQRYSLLTLQVCSDTLFLVCDLLHLPLQPVVIPIKFMNYHCISAFRSHPLSSIISKPFFLTNFILTPLSLAQNNRPTSFPYLMGASKYSIPPSLNSLHPVIQPVSEGCIMSVYEPHPPPFCDKQS